MTLSDDHLDLLRTLTTERDSLGLTDADFARRWLPFSPSKWSRILEALKPGAESYFDLVKDADPIFAQLTQALAEIRLDRAVTTRITDDPILPLHKFRAIAQAVRECRAKKNPERLIVYLAPTGGGKTMLCHYLRQQFSAALVETREAWRRSYFCTLTDICTAAHVRLAGEYNTARIEDRLIDSFSSRSIILALDEGEYFGAAALNGVKLLLNKTRVTIVLCAIPLAYERWNRHHPMESEQLMRRTHAIIEESRLDPRDVSLFFPDNQFDDRPKALQLLCNVASTFGFYSLIRRVRDDDELSDRPTSLDTLSKSITRARRQMLRT